MHKNHSGNKLVLPVLAYHELYAKKEDEIHCARTMGPSCALSKANFQRHLELIVANEVQTITFKDLSDVQQNYRNYGNDLLILTFDDGHIGNYYYAYPLLARDNLSAVFFVTTNFIETYKMMNWAQLREMSENGMSIQSHGMSHEPFETLSLEEIEEELSYSKKIIEDKTGNEVDTISLPHGSMHRKTLEKARNIGYKFVCTSIINYFEFLANDGAVAVPRIPIYSSMKFDIYSDIIKRSCVDVYKWKRIQKIKYAIKMIIGINNYRRIFRLVHNIKINQ